MDQYVNLWQLLWPGLILAVMGVILLRFRNVVASIFGLGLALTGIYYGLLAFSVIDITTAMLVTLIVALLVGIHLTRTKGFNTVFGVIVVLLSVLALIALLTTYFPNFQAGQWIKDTLNYLTQVVGQILHLSDQGLSLLQQ